MGGERAQIEDDQLVVVHHHLAQVAMLSSLDTDKEALTTLYRLRGSPPDTGYEAFSI